MPSALSDELRDELLDRWSEPHRTHHNVAHLREVLAAVGLLADKGLVFDRDAVDLAAWFHDAVYDIGRDDNEERSADLARERLASSSVRDEVARLVLLTKTHLPADGDVNGAVFSDADLSVLGSDPTRYARYARAVREEYAAIPDDVFARARTRVLTALLDGSVFHTQAGRDLWEDRARSNLTGEIEDLTRPGTIKTRTRSSSDTSAPNSSGGPVSTTDIEPSEVTKWDPGLTERVMGWIRPLIKGYHRAEVRGLDDFPPGGALVVANHSGGLFAMDVPVFATGFYERYGYDRPVFTLSHDIIFTGPTADFFRKTGFIPANHENADEALRSGGVVVVFPGGDYDVYRPTLSESKIDFDGRTGYVRAALNAGVPIVPSVSIGGQEAQLFLSRGEWLAKAARLDKLMRVKILPISFGFPFGLSAVLPVNVPLPTKIVTQVLAPIDIVAQFGEDPDVDEVDAHVRHVMQRALDELARERRIPVLG
jgi:predicted metal-dependent HD superfamily phosphohydrolase/1-acyl-sn-glycerol-3-phosphate acyltransferase